MYQASYRIMHSTILHQLQLGLVFMIIPQWKGNKGFSFFATHIIKFVKKINVQS